MRIATGAVKAVGRDLGADAVEKDGHGAVPDAGGTQAAEQAQHVLRQRLRGDVPVVDGPVQQRVAHAAADVPGLKPGVLDVLMIDRLSASREPNFYCRLQQDQN
ncbi:MAG: hypothetical protein V8S98_11425 [Lachnospiraceae bacterium]